MPRDGSGRAHNEVEDTNDIIHGVGDKGDMAASGVDRSSKAAPPPEPESGNALEGMGASGGGDKPTGSGKGPVKPTVDEEAEKAGK